MMTGMVFSLTTLYAQDTIPSLTVDSMLTVGDSASFNRSVRVAQHITVEGMTVMQQDATAGSDFKVEGNLYLPNIPGLTALDKEMILVTNAEGLTERLSVGALLEPLYSFSCAPVGGVVQSPTWANGPNKLFVACPEVQVGVGTNAPTRSLEVNGTTKISGHTWLGTSLSLGADVNGFAKCFIRNQERSAAIEIDNTGNTMQYPKLLYFEFDNTGTEIMKVQNTALNYSPFLLNSSGAMTINNGTGNILNLQADGKFTLTNGTTQSFQVDANGFVHARRMKLDLDSWPDYVFEPTYRLMPLSQLETYIQTEKHLPNVPAEQTLVQNGADIMELNKILMEKVEELTLYLIEQHKNTLDQQQQLVALQQQIEELKKKLETLEPVK